MVWHFIGVYIINRILHDRLEIRNFSSRVEKYFSTLEEKFRISKRPYNILYMYHPLKRKLFKMLFVILNIVDSYFG